MIFEREDNYNDYDNRCIEYDNLFSPFYNLLDSIKKKINKSIQCCYKKNS